jgi:hypothetical protein
MSFFWLMDENGRFSAVNRVFGKDWEAVTLKGELAHRASLISISLSGQPGSCDNVAQVQ